MRSLSVPTLPEALITGAIWAIICIVSDLVGWVLIKHPWRLTFREFYIDYQPWITLIYLAIFAGPVVGFFATRG
jgi:membrane-associated phospholipid phosphatase